MRKIIAAILALTLALGACFMLSSCGGKTDDPTTTAAADTSETVEETAAPSEALTGDIGETVTPSESAPAEEGTTEEPTTLVTVTAPVGGSVADIVTYYNNAVNGAKKYPGKMTVKRTQGTVSSLEEISIGLAQGVVEGVLPNDYPKNETQTFVNGKSSSGKTAASFFPVDDKPYASNLTPAGVKSATCTANGKGSKVVITLISEDGNDINFVPKHHASCADTLALTQEDLDPLTINECHITYTGMTLTAEIDEFGRVTSLKVSEPVTIEGKVAWKKLNLIEVKVLGTWKQEFVVTY